MILNILQSKTDKEISESFGKLNSTDLLINSCRYGYFIGVKRAIDKRVDPSTRNNQAIRYASLYGHVEVVELLLNDPRVNPSALNNLAIRNASKNGHIEVVELLLTDKRVDPSAENNQAIRWASEKGHVEVVELLLTDKRVKL